MTSSRCAFLLVVVLSLIFLTSLVATTEKCYGKAEEREAVSGTICQLVHEPNRFKGKTVRVKAIVESDLIEHTMLTDPSCESDGVSLWIPHDLDDNAEVKALRNALKEQWKPGALKTQVSGVFTGSLSAEGKKRFLKVSKIEDIRVSGS